MANVTSAQKWPEFRLDLLRVAGLIVLVVLVWCAVYNRWTVASWQTPIEYNADPQKDDSIGIYAIVRAARDGHFSPFQFTNIPELGAPYVAIWDDVPTTEKPLFLMMGILAHVVGIFAAANFAVLLGHVLAAISFYAACRLVGGEWLWSFAGALVFAFARFAFAHGLHHIPILYYWHLPLCLVACEWMIRGEGLKFGDRKLIFALVMGVVVGVQNIYYTNMFVQLVLFGALIQGVRRGFRASLPAIAVVQVTAAAFFLMNINGLVFQLIHGANARAVIRFYDWMEIYGLKVVDMVVPPPNHSFPPFAWWGMHHVKEVYLSPGELPPAAYIGLAGLGALAWLSVVSFRNLLNGLKLPFEFFLVLWIFVYAEVGGINTLIGAMGFHMFRATTRYSIFILCVLLMFAVRRLSQIAFSDRFLVYRVTILCVGLALWEQTPPMVSAKEKAAIGTTVNSDRLFAEQMEKELPPKAMIFQLPVMYYPESPANGLGAYDHFRPYLYSRDLRYSFGSVKGRVREEWQEKLSDMKIDEAVPKLEKYGFSAVYVNLRGLKGDPKEMIQAFKDIGRNDMLQSEEGDLLCVFLKPSTSPILPDEE